jgi:hypothetical protein
MRTAHRLLVATTSVLVVACGFSDAERYSTLRTRAAFDLKCPADALQITDLTNTGALGRVTSAGVDGCGRRLTYILDAPGRVWVLNAVDGRPVTNMNDPARKEAN